MARFRGGTRGASQGLHTPRHRSPSPLIARRPRSPVFRGPPSPEFRGRRSPEVRSPRSPDFRRPNSPVFQGARSPAVRRPHSPIVQRPGPHPTGMPLHVDQVLRSVHKLRDVTRMIRHGIGCMPLDRTMAGRVWRDVSSSNRIFPIHGCHFGNLLWMS